jgi:site-specific recombinase XerD
MTSSNHLSMDPLIEGYLSYLDKVGRKTARTIIDVRCTLRHALSRLRTDVPLWRMPLEDYRHWLETERESGCTETGLAKYLSHLRGPRV